MVLQAGEIDYSSLRLNDIFNDLIPFFSNSDFDNARDFIENVRLSDNERIELTGLLRTFEKAQMLEGLRNPAVSVLRLSGSSGVGKSTVAAMLREDLHEEGINTLLIEEAVDDNPFLAASVSEEDEAKRRYNLILSQLHFMRSTWELTLDGIAEMNESGGGVVVVDQSDKGHRAIRGYMEKYSVLGGQPRELLDIIDTLLAQAFPRVKTTDILLVADYFTLSERVIDRNREFEIDNPFYQAANLGQRQNRMMSEYGFQIDDNVPWHLIEMRFKGEGRDQYPNILDTTDLSLNEAVGEVRARMDRLERPLLRRMLTDIIGKLI